MIKFIKIIEIGNLPPPRRHDRLRLPRLFKINFYNTFHSCALWIHRTCALWIHRTLKYLKAGSKVYWWMYPVFRDIYYSAEHLKFSKRQLIKMGDIAREDTVTVIKLADSEIVEIPPPKVFPASDQKYLNSTLERYTFPEIYVAHLKDTIIYGGTNLVLLGDKVICHDLFDFRRDFTSEELHRRTIVYPKSLRIRWLRSDKEPVPIPRAATFVDACAQNYAHWLTEVLPRICFFCTDERYKDVSIVVNAGLHQNIMESLFLVTRDDREIITLPTGRAISVDDLYFTSATGYVPFGQRTNKLKGHSHGVFSPQAFRLLRNHLDSLVPDTEEQAWPEKVFLRRSSGTRKVANEAEVVSLMISQGYVIIEPEKLTFTQQVQLFKKVRTIIASTGAALANAIFCKPGAQVTVLMGKHESMIYKYWSNMLEPLGIEVNYILGRIVGPKSHGIHGDFEVNITDVVNLLKALERK